MEIQQSAVYARYVQQLGWDVVRIKGGNMFIRRFPLLGGYAKIQRVSRLPPLTTLLPVLQHHNVSVVAVEPDASVNQPMFQSWIAALSRSFRVSRTHFLPTKTIRIDLDSSEEDIFRHFSEAKRRAVRRALKNHVTVEKSSDISSFIRLKNKSAGFLGFITTSGLRTLWSNFTPHQATLLFAYRKNLSTYGIASCDTQLVAGVLLLFSGRIVYYWMAAATREGKKLFAPTLLVWEALKLAKKRGGKQFDFVGVWDERLPNRNKEWLGFTKFKEGFGGRQVYYPFP